jgi:MoxR-like ATPase
LPEAQLDRFLLKLRVTYPAQQDEVQLLANVQNGFESRELDKMNLNPIAPELLETAQQEIKAVTVQESLFGYIVQVVRRTRDWPSLSLGASPRAAVILRPEADLEGVTPDQVIEEVLRAVEVPK